ncbi:hypothetical protein CJ030_MR1G005944 [Morella rubra]|uniref:Uncharacterized protein n=1 Tax=Morella rubra TaxID=262757 RepID=A0A6A1WQB8_9ROSI|nr:hypothetical protein CJ030_MR1G005944 [Morella rubra]
MSRRGGGRQSDSRRNQPSPASSTSQQGGGRGRGSRGGGRDGGGGGRGGGRGGRGGAPLRRRLTSGPSYSGDCFSGRTSTGCYNSVGVSCFVEPCSATGFNSFSDVCCCSEHRNGKASKCRSQLRSFRHRHHRRLRP